MADVTLTRIGELLRCVLEILWNKPEGMPAKELIAALPDSGTAHGGRESLHRSRGYSSLREDRPIVDHPAGPRRLAGKEQQRPLVHHRGGPGCVSQVPQRAGASQRALRLFEEVKQGAPAAAMVVEEAEEKAWEQVQNYLLETRRLEFRTLIAELLQAMGYHVAWIAPPEKDHGQIDMVAYTDPLGASGPRILVQIKHKGQPTTMEGMKSFLSVLNQRDYGLLVSSGGFTCEVTEEIGTDTFQKTTLLDLENFFDLWVKYYDKLSDEAKSRFPLKKIYFLCSLE